MEMELEKAIVAMILIFLLVIGACFGLGYVSSYYGCKEVGSKMNFPSQYDAKVGCMIQVSDGRWIPLDSYKYVEVK